VFTASFVHHHHNQPGLLTDSSCVLNTTTTTTSHQARKENYPSNMLTKQSSFLFPDEEEEEPLGLPDLIATITDNSSTCGAGSTLSEDSSSMRKMMMPTVQSQLLNQYPHLMMVGRSFHEDPLLVEFSQVFLSESDIIAV